MSFVEEFHQDFSRFLRVYTVQFSRVIVMIEDLDRCDPSKAADLLKAINLLIPDVTVTEPTEGSKLIFVIAIDRAKVAAGLASAHESLAKYVTHRDLTDLSGVNVGDVLAHWYEYLEKFVQLPFRLPRADKAGVKEYIRDLVNAPVVDGSSTLAASEKALERGATKVDHDWALEESIVSEMAPYLGYNPRRIKQFLGLFRLRHHVLAQELSDDSAVKETLRLVGRSVAFELLWPRLVDALYRDPTIVRDLEAVSHGTRTADNDTRLQCWVNDARLLEFLRTFDSKDGTVGIAAKYIPWVVGIARTRDSGAGEAQTFPPTTAAPAASA